MKKLQVTSYKLLKTIITLSHYLIISSFFCFSAFLPSAVFAQKLKTTATQQKVFTKNYMVNSKDVLNIKAKFTHISFVEWDKNEVCFTTTVSLKNGTENEMERLLKAINITINQTGKNISYKLTLSEEKLKDFEINLLVNMPRDVFLKIENSFGNTEIGDMMNNFNATISFGDLMIEHLRGSDNNIELKHGNLKLEKAENLSFDVQFSEGKIKEVNTLKLNSRFNTIKIEKAKSVFLRPSAHDNISILNSVEKMEGEMEFGELKIKSLVHSCIFDKFSFSNIKINEVLKSFTTINFSSSKHSTLILNVPSSLSFAFDYAGSFTDFKEKNIKLNESTFEASGNSIEMSGIYGKDNPSGKSVKIRASFGSVSLFER